MNANQLARQVLEQIITIPSIENRAKALAYVLEGLSTGLSKSVQDDTKTLVAMGYTEPEALEKALTDVIVDVDAVASGLGTAASVMTGITDLVGGLTTSAMSIYTTVSETKARQTQAEYERTMAQSAAAAAQARADLQAQQDALLAEQRAALQAQMPLTITAPTTQGTGIPIWAMLAGGGLLASLVVILLLK